MTEEGQILNSLGEDIPEKHGVVARPLATKSRGPLSIAIMREIKAGNGIDGAVLIDIREVLKNRGENEWSPNRRYTTFRDKLKATERLLKVAPICHFNMGGLIVDESGDTGIPGLYAAGEVVGGIHGANRHGGNALTDITVFGARAGAAATEYVKGRSLRPVEPLVKSDISHYDKIRKGDSESKVSPRDVMTGLRKIMWRARASEVVVLRDKASMMSASSGREMLLALEVPMALDTAEMIIRAAIARKESRGAHFRKDYPEEDESWLRTIVIGKGDDGKMRISTRSL